MADVTSISEWREHRDAQAGLGDPPPNEASDDGVTELAEAADAAGAAEPDLERERQEVRGALSKFVLGEDEGWLLFERAATDGQIGLPERALQLAGILRERPAARHIPAHVLKDALEAVIPELAAELLPGSPAAAWERLLERALVDEISYNDPAGAVLRLAAADARFFRQLTRLALREPDQAELVRAAREVWVELRRRGHRFEPRGFTDFVWQALRELFPGHPGTGWDEEWASAIRADTHADLRRHLRGAGLSPDDIDVSGFLLRIAETREAEGRGDRTAFRLAARRAVAAGRRAVREAAP